MKVAHHNQEHFHSGEEMLQQAKELEDGEEFTKAASLYLRYLKILPGNEFAFSRLMIIYRKLGEPKKELEIIDRAIKTFEQIFQKSQRKRPTRKTVEISRKLMKSMGLADRKGKELFEREPLGKWKRRRALVMKKIKS
jgi:tetratricopeptide (TPR) repeat protein